MARDKRVDAEWQDEDGYWIALTPGWQDNFNPTCHTIHEDTKKEAHEVLKSSIPCDCDDCQKCIEERHNAKIHTRD